jgi:hypothetical protein
VKNKIQGDNKMKTIQAMINKNQILAVIVFNLILVSHTYSQIQFTPHIITTDARWAVSVYAIDVDDDGDMDVLSASEDDSKIAWYENDGNENFTPHTITTSTSRANSVYAEDMDGDGDMDVLSASFLIDPIEWYENDGNENFTTHTIATSRVVMATSVQAVDIDSDGDMDVLSTSLAFTTIAWYENDGNENFTTHAISNSAAGAVYAIDVDGDGDIDVLSASDDKVTWHENDGNENFTTHTISDGAAGPVYAVDVDGDGDIDVLSGVAWYENDGNENFAPHTIITSLAGSEKMGPVIQSLHHPLPYDFANSVYAVDVDGDRDMDVLFAFWEVDKITCYENDGNENFTPHNIFGADAPNSVYAVDVDSDGDMDVLSASAGDDKIAWYENMGSDGIDDNYPSFFLYNNFPNPFNPSTSIEFTMPRNEYVELKIYTILGEEVAKLVSNNLDAGAHQYQFDGSTLASGIYYYRIQAGEFQDVKKMVLLR